MIKNYIDTDPQRISEALESHKNQLEFLNQKCNDLKDNFKEKEEFYRNCIGEKIDMERVGQQVDNKLNKLFREQELANERLNGKPTLCIT